MLETLNHTLYDMMKAPADLAGVALHAPVAIGDWAIFAGPAVLATLWLWGSIAERRAAVRAGLAATVGLTVSGLLSSLYFHPRPFMDGAARNMLNHAVDSSFPSDHATVLFALSFTLMLSGTRRSRWPATILLVVTLAVSWSRNYLGAHYPLDILGGAAVGFGCALAFGLRPLREISDGLSDFASRLYDLLSCLVRR